MNTCPVSAIPHPALTLSKRRKVKAQAISFIVSTFPAHLGEDGIFSKKDELNSIEKFLFEQIAAKVDIICRQR